MTPVTLLTHSSGGSWRSSMEERSGRRREMKEGERREKKVRGEGWGGLWRKVGKEVGRHCFFFLFFFIADVIVLRSHRSGLSNTLIAIYLVKGNVSRSHGERERARPTTRTHSPIPTTPASGLWSTTTPSHRNLVHEKFAGLQCDLR